MWIDELERISRECLELPPAKLEEIRRKVEAAHAGEVRLRNAARRRLARFKRRDSTRTPRV